ncbi:MAG TPA: DNA replication/repair protein RecF [Gammaproteobacteria bacterium]
MRLQSLGIRDLRLFQQADIEAFGRLNLVYGPNASGKTTLLEAIYLLATARSFRTPNLSELMRHGSDCYQIRAKVSDAHGKTVALGLERTAQTLLLRAAGRKVQRASELAQWLPVQIIHPDSHQLISGGPKSRRRFLDWGVFHVEPAFQGIWKRYDKALKQRNAALKSRSFRVPINIWDPELSEAATEIDRLRRRYVDEIKVILPEFIRAIMVKTGFDLHYYPGRSGNQSLQEELAHTLERDRRRGFTCSGPHRADLVFSSDGRPAAEVISRGQQKMLVIALFLAQAELLARKTGQSGVLLFDDLAAELDQSHRRRTLEALQKMAVQVIITALDRNAIELPAGAETKLFHVEHGCIAEVI